HVDSGPRKQRSDRRTQGGDGRRMVRGAAFRHRGHLQNLCRKFSQRSAFEFDHQRSAGDCRPGNGEQLEVNTMNATRLLHNLGQSIWLDNITRDLLNSGTLKRYIRDLSVTGLTSNPSIFDHAIKNSDAYNSAIAAQAQNGKSAEELFFELALDDLT